MNTWRNLFVSVMIRQSLSRVLPRGRSGRPVLSLSVALLVLSAHPWLLRAQAMATVEVEENLRAEPRGVILGRLITGSRFPVVEVTDQWVEVAVEGWMWTASLRADDRMGFDLSVAASPQENLRLEPSGAIVARLREGALVEKVDDVPGWTYVRRVAWIWGASLNVAGEPETSAAGEPRGSGRSSAETSWWQSGTREAPILSAPDGDTLGRVASGTQLQVLAREGNWVRVRLEGWSWAPVEQGGDSLGTAAVSDISPEDVGRAPESYRGKVVSWELQFVSLERAERVRTDFYEGEPFLLTRTAATGNGFVYVAIPPERLSEVEGLIPLERIRVVGRIRVGAAALTENPILDLLELTRISRR